MLALPPGALPTLVRPLKRAGRDLSRFRRRRNHWRRGELRLSRSDAKYPKQTLLVLGLDPSRHLDVQLET